MRAQLEHRQAHQCVRKCDGDVLCGVVGAEAWVHEVGGEGQGSGSAGGKERGVAAARRKSRAQVRSRGALLLRRQGYRRRRRPRSARGGAQHTPRRAARTCGVRPHADVLDGAGVQALAEERAPAGLVELQGAVAEADQQHVNFKEV